MSVDLTGTKGVPFGRYQLLERLGVGGMAIVYRAVVNGPKNFQRTLVIKRVIPHLAHDPSFVTMLAAEARLAALLLHPNIVQVHEFGDVDGEYYLAMELVDGCDLSAVLRQARARQFPLSPGMVCFMISELCSALAYAHALTDEQGVHLEIVHRDVTPSNIMVTRHGRLKLVDFGIAKASAHVSEERTRTGTLKGKLHYMSPEQVQGQHVDARTDIFALGVVLYEALTLRRCFKGETEAQTIRSICDLDVVPPSQHVPDIDPELEAVVLKMLARDVNQRYASADEVARALQPIMRRLGGGDAESVRELLGQLGLPQPVARPLTPSDIFLAPAHDRAGDGSSSHGSRAYLKGELVESAPILISPPWSWRKRLPVIAAAAAATVAGLVLLVGRGGPSKSALEAAARPEAPQARAPIVTPLPPSEAQKLAPATRATASSAPRATAAPGLAVPAAGAPATTAPAATPAPAAPARPVATKVRLRITGTDGADVLVDGAQVGRVPLEIELPRKDGARTLLVRKAGFTRYERSIDGQAEAVLLVELGRAARPSPPKKATSSSKSVIADPFAP